ncbi:MAG: prepilin-type N-terminal cleavage/methylation domain-containing protein [Pseudomonadota bacterium]|nr:prepilin-type N-terminal cleavage/methylation domain-containing protein [Pseudomonadota bacterium]
MLRKSKPSPQNQGFTLIELMIAILLAAIVIGATMAFLFSTVKSNIENIKMTRMNQELRAVMTLMTDEIKRAGFSTAASGASAMIDELAWNAGDDCLSYAYQTTSVADPTVSVKSFKLDSGSGVILYNEGNSGLCGGTALNDPDIVSVTDFETEIVFPGFGGASLAQVTVSLAGQTLHRGSVLSERTITEVIRVRNELPQ